MIGLLNAGPHVYTFTIEQLWTSILGVCGGITAIAAAVAVILNAIKKAKEPDTKQNAKLNDHDKHLEDVDRKLKNDKEVLDLYRSKILSLEEHQKEQDVLLEEHSRKMAAAEQHLEKNDHALSVVMQALLALLSHGIDGNSVEPMKEAKAILEKYLING
jgi:septal ring factor EnvC (AmiA/AmiB activator)